MVKKEKKLQLEVSFLARPNQSACLQLNLSAFLKRLNQPAFLKRKKIAKKMCQKAIDEKRRKGTNE